MTAIASPCDSGCRQKTTPQSYGTFSHLCASVAQESARSQPSVRWRKRGLAAAQSPNAPSMWSQAPSASQASAISPSGSTAPVFTFPAWAQTIVGPLPSARAARSASARIRPSPSAGTGSSAAVPSPSSRSERSIVTCRSPPASTRICGAPARPSRPTSHPAAASTCCRAAARAVVFAPWAPVTKPLARRAGSPSKSASQTVATSSAAAAAGDRTTENAFWSHVVATQSAATEAGSALPITKPK